MKSAVILMRSLVRLLYLLGIGAIYSSRYLDLHGSLIFLKVANAGSLSFEMVVVLPNEIPIWFPGRTLYLA